MNQLTQAAILIQSLLYIEGRYFRDVTQADWAKIRVGMFFSTLSAIGSTLALDWGRYTPRPSGPKT